MNFRLQHRENWYSFDSPSDSHIVIIRNDNVFLEKHSTLYYHKNLQIKNENIVEKKKVSLITYRIMLWYFTVFLNKCFQTS